MTLQRLFRILIARWRFGAFVFAVVVAVVAAFNLMSPKKYTATASVVVDANVDPLKDASAPELSSNYLATQVDIINSPRVAQRAVMLLKLDQDPTLVRAWKQQTGGGGDIKSWIAEDIASRVSAEPSRESSVLEINAKWSNAHMAAAVANAVAQAYIDTTIELKVDPAKQNAGWFDRRIKDLRADLEEKQRQLSDFENQHQITGTDEHLDIEAARLGELSTQLTTIEAQHRDSQSKRRQASSSADSSPEVMDNQLIGSLKRELAQEEGRLKDIGVNLGTNHPSYRTAAAQVASLRERIDKETQRVTVSLTAINNINLDKENAIREALESQKQHVLRIKHDRDQLSVLRGDVETAQHNLDSAAQRLAQVSLESQVQQTNAVLLTAASDSVAPSSPRVILNICLSALIGAALGVAAALLLELADPRVRTEEELVELLSVPLMGRLNKRPKSVPTLTTSLAHAPMQIESKA